MEQAWPKCDNTPLTDTQAHLVTPAPGATGVSPTIGSITVAYGNVNVLNMVTLSPSDGSVGVPANEDYSGGPTASGTVRLLIPPLKPATTYTVIGQRADMVHAVGCFQPVTAYFGSFTTQ